MRDGSSKAQVSTRLARTSLVVLAVACCLLTATSRPMRARALTEYQIKAAFLFNFARFVEWPAGTFPDADTPLTIGVLGEDPFGAILDRTIEGESVRDRRLVVLRSHDVEDLKRCHLLFVSRSEQARLGVILRELSTSPVLTVSEIEDFTGRGGIVAFYLDRKRVRFAVNPTSARRCGLKLSSQLLRLGRITADGT